MIALFCFTREGATLVFTCEGFSGRFYAPSFLFLRKGVIAVETLNYIAQRKREILKMLAIDRDIKADPYDNLARLKEVEKIEKVLCQELSRKVR